MYQTLNIKANAINLVEENIGSFLHDTDMEQNALNRTPFSQDLKPIIFKGGLHKIKKLFYNKKQSVRRNGE